MGKKENLLVGFDDEAWGNRAPSINIGWTDEIVLYCIWQLMTVDCRIDDDAIGLALLAPPRPFLCVQIFKSCGGGWAGVQEFSQDWQLSAKPNSQTRLSLGSWCHGNELERS